MGYCHGGGRLKECKHFLIGSGRLGPSPSSSAPSSSMPAPRPTFQKRCPGRRCRWPCSGQRSQWELLAREASWLRAHRSSSRSSSSSFRASAGKCIGVWTVLPRRRGQTNLDTAWRRRPAEEIMHNAVHVYVHSCATESKVHATLG